MFLCDDKEPVLPPAIRFGAMITGLASLSGRGRAHELAGEGSAG